MQDDVVEVTFCDLCGTSVPIGDFGAGTAIRHADKVIGSCCLTALRGAEPVVAAPAPAAALLPVAPPAPRAAGDSRLLTVAVVLLAAIAAATIFVDHRLTSVETAARTNHDQSLQAQRSDGDVLRKVDMAMDGAPKRADVDALAARIGEVATAAAEANIALKKQLDTLRQELAVAVQEQQARAAQAVDVRPLFDDLRERNQRLMEVVVAMRSATPPADVGVPAPAPAPATPSEGSGPPALPEALANHVKNLKADDPAVRFEAVDELLRSKEPQVLPHLLPLSRDPDSLVRRLTVEGLGGFKRSEAVEALLLALGDGDESVREAAYRSLKDVTGQKFPFESGSVSKDARARAIQRWQDWWDKNKATFGS